jgi:hypothetical protein
MRWALSLMDRMGLMHRRQARLLYDVMRNTKQERGDLNQPWASRELPAPSAQRRQPIFTWVGEPLIVSENQVTYVGGP